MQKRRERNYLYAECHFSACDYVFFRYEGSNSVEGKKLSKLSSEHDERTKIIYNFNFFNHNFHF